MLFCGSMPLITMVDPSKVQRVYIMKLWKVISVVYPFINLAFGGCALRLLQCLSLNYNNTVCMWLVNWYYSRFTESSCILYLLYDKTGKWNNCIILIQWFYMPLALLALHIRGYFIESKFTVKTHMYISRIFHVGFLPHITH